MELRECTADEAANKLRWAERICQQDLVDALVNALNRISCLETELAQIKSGLSQVSAAPQKDEGFLGVRTDWNVNTW